MLGRWMSEGSGRVLSMHSVDVLWRVGFFLLKKKLETGSGELVPLRWLIEST